MTRSKQLWTLMILTSLTLATIYSFQPLLLHKSPTEISDLLWMLERLSWMFRAIIDAWTIIYLAQTKTQTGRQAALVWTLKVALLGLIPFTLGPVFMSIGEGSTIKEVLRSDFHFRAWSYGIALYGPLMMAAAAVAYKIQPYDIDAEREAQQALENANDEIDRLNGELITTKHGLSSIEQRADKAERELSQVTDRAKQAEKTLSKIDGKTVRLFGNDKKLRIETAQTLWPELPQRSIAQIADASPAYVHEVLNGRAKQNGSAK